MFFIFVPALYNIELNPCFSRSAATFLFLSRTPASLMSPQFTESAGKPNLYSRYSQRLSRKVLTAA